MYARGRAVSRSPLPLPLSDGFGGPRGDWDGKTALCPYCAVLSVLPEPIAGTSGLGCVPGSEPSPPCTYAIPSPLPSLYSRLPTVSCSVSLGLKMGRAGHVEPTAAPTRQAGPVFYSDGVGVGVRMLKG